jgi:tRNA(Ile)-lysidine synthase
MTGTEAPWCVAFSGGADSLALLLLIWSHWPERRATLTALHFNHRLRGGASEGDERFCRDLCVSLGVGFRCESWRAAPAAPSEGEAREARHAFFARAMAGLGAHVLWTGHQKDDIAETQLMRLARGSSSAGLAAPRPVQTLADGRVFLRPLLTLAKADIVAALRTASLAWREDETNASGDFFRNRLRREVLPAWRKCAPNDALDGAALTRELLADDDSALEIWLKSVLPAGAYSENRFNARTLAGLPRALWRRALRRWAPAAELGRESFERLLSACDRGAGCINAGAGEIVVEAGVLHFENHARPSATPWRSATLHPGICLVLPDGAELRAEPVSFDGDLRARVLGGKVDAEREAYLAHFDGAFTVRAWCAGDRYAPLGLGGSAKLQDLFVNRKIPVEKRLALPLVCEGESILWIPGFPPAANSKVTDDSVTGVRLTYHPGTYTVRPKSQQE